MTSDQIHKTPDLRAYSPEEPCWCGSGKAYGCCHQAIEDRMEQLRAQGHLVPTRAMLKTPAQIEKIRESCKVNIAVLDEVAARIREGMTTGEIDRIVSEKTAELGGVAAPLGYQGYPYSVCTSVNDQVCHGFPSDEVVLEEGDIVNVDCSTIVDGFFSDSSRMFVIGETDEETQQLVDVTRECVMKGLEQVKPWGFLGDVAQAIQDHAAEYEYSVVREVGGHAIGLEFHEDPYVSYVTEKGTDMVLVPGMIFTIEPMINMGDADICLFEDNDWELYTEDGYPSAQWEIMVLVTDTGHEVLCW